MGLESIKKFILGKHISPPTRGVSDQNFCLNESENSSIYSIKNYVSPINSSISESKSGSVSKGIFSGLSSGAKYGAGVAVLGVKWTLHLVNLAVIGVGGTVIDAICAGSSKWGLAGGIGGGGVGAIAGTFVAPGPGTALGAIVGGGIGAGIGGVGGFFYELYNGSLGRSANRMQAATYLYAQRLDEIANSLMGGSDSTKVAHS